MIKLPNYLTKPGPNCVLTSFGNVVSYYNHTLNDSILFFLEDGFRFDYIIEGTKSIVDIKLEHKCLPLIRSFCSRYEIDIKYEKIRECYEYEMFKPYLENELIAGRPVIIEVNPQILEYNSFYQNPKNIDGIPHHLVVIGIDDDEIIVSDCFVPVLPKSSFYEGPLKLSQLKVAYKNNNLTLFKINYQKIKKLNLTITPEVLITALQKNFRLYFHADGSYLQKLLQLSSDLSKLDKRYSKKEITNNIKYVGGFIQSNGIIFARKYLIEYLLMLKNQYQIEFAAEKVCELDAIITAWHNLVFYIIKCGYAPTSPNFQNLGKKVEKLVNWEAEVFNKICQQF